MPRDDADLSTKGLKNHAILAQKFLDELNDRNPFVTIFLLDCCRQYYLRDPDLERLRSRATNINMPNLGGLREMHDSTGSSLIAFACASGAIANDDDQEGHNGLFTKHLLKHIGSPNKDIRMILAAVTNGVKQESGTKQIRYCYSVLTHENIYLCDQESGNCSVEIRCSLLKYCET